MQYLYHICETLQSRQAFYSWFFPEITRSSWRQGSRDLQGNDLELVGPSFHQSWRLELTADLANEAN